MDTPHQIAVMITQQPTTLYSFIIKKTYGQKTYTADYFSEGQEVDVSLISSLLERIQYI